jgi:hypothetical protein
MAAPVVNPVDLAVIVQITILLLIPQVLTATRNISGKVEI